MQVHLWKLPLSPAHTFGCDSASCAVSGSQRAPSTNMPLMYAPPSAGAASGCMPAGMQL
jgi:hypothetical protein